MKTMNFASKANLVKYLNEHHPNLYKIPPKFRFDRTNMFKKDWIEFKECSCRTRLCPAGLQRGVKCKRCHPITKESIREQRNPIRKSYTPMSGYWGTLYYIKIKTIEGALYKLGISQDGIQARFTSDEFEKIEPIFEMPFKTRAEAKRVEYHLLNEYKSVSAATKSNLLDIYPLRSGHTETFTEDLMLLEGTMSHM